MSLNTWLWSLGLYRRECAWRAVGVVIIAAKQRTFITDSRHYGKVLSGFEQKLCGLTEIWALRRLVRTRVIYRSLD